MNVHDSITTNATDKLWMFLDHSQKQANNSVDIVNIH